MTPEPWREQLARAESDRARAETKLNHAMRHLAEVQADQITRDQRFREALLRSVAALLEGLRESPPEG